MTHHEKDEAELRAHIERIVGTIRAKDRDALRKLYKEDVVS